MVNLSLSVKKKKNLFLHRDFLLNMFHPFIVKLLLQLSNLQNFLLSDFSIFFFFSDEQTPNEVGETGPMLDTVPSWTVS
jgi:hypothetical protein